MSAVAIYTRISSADREEQTATARQEAACRALAELRGWEVAEVFEDVDISAYAKTTRPSYERLLAAVDAGVVDGVVVWKLDRLVRRVAEFERLWARCEAKQVMLASVTEPIDTSSALGLAIVRVLVTFAALESATMGTRIRAQAKAMAEQGAAPGTPAYGYTKGYTEIVPEEAKVIREAARRVLAGETSHQIVLDFNRRGIASPGGKRWRETALNELLSAPRLSGQRVWHGEVVATECWPKILSVAQTKRLRVVLADRHRARPGKQGSYLLSSLCRCSECGCGLAAASSYKGALVYRCNPSPNGCAKVSVTAANLEPYVVASLADHVRRLPLRTTAHERRAANRIRDRKALGEPALEGLRQLARDHYVDRRITRAEYLAARLGLLAQLGEAATAVAARRAALQPDETAAMLARWDGLDTAARQALLRQEITKITVRPSTSGRYFDPARVAIEWRHDAIGDGAAAPDGWGTEGLVGTAEAAEALRVSRSMLQRAINTGALPATRREGRFLMTVRDLDAWATSHPTEATGRKYPTGHQWRKARQERADQDQPLQG